MLDTILDFVDPHYCCECNKIGTLLCEECKYNIMFEQNCRCISCLKPTVNSCICTSCKTYFEKAWFVGERAGGLQRLVGLYKFERAKNAYRILAELLSETLPDLPNDTVIVPVPTTPPRIRERGYDHMLLVAKRLAKLRNLRCSQLIERVTGTKQRQANAKLREQQAKQAFVVKNMIDPDVPYLILDDVVTTGATIRYCAKALTDAGAKHIWVGVVARQILK